MQNDMDVGAVFKVLEEFDTSQDGIISYFEYACTRARLHADTCMLAHKSLTHNHPRTHARSHPSVH